MLSLYYYVIIIYTFTRSKCVNIIVQLTIMLYTFIIVINNNRSRLSYLYNYLL